MAVRTGCHGEIIPSFFKLRDDLIMVCTIKAITIRAVIIQTIRDLEEHLVYLLKFSLFQVLKKGRNYFWRGGVK
ncbi:MAG: hypothetical protein ACPL7L_00785 [bacterium]